MKHGNAKLIALFCFCCLMAGCGKQSEQLPAETEFTMTLTTESQLFTESASPVITTTRNSKTTSISATETTQIRSDMTSSTSTSQTSTSTAVTADIPEQNNIETITIHKNNDSGNNTNKSGNSSNQATKSTKKQTTTTVTETITEPLPTEFTTEPETDPETEPTTEVIFKTGTVWEIMDMMTLEEKIYQLFVVTPELLTGAGTVTNAGEQTRNALISQPVGGLVYFADNLVNVSQTTAMLSNSQQYARESGIGLFLAVDEEGGLVARCAKKLGTTKLSPMATYGSRNDFNEAFSVGQTLGYDISQFGFNLDFAPVADVNLNSGNELGNRIFSDNPEVTANMVSGVVQGLQSTGVASTLKHFPGLGAEDGNAHYDAAVYIDRTLEQLRTEEFIPFQSGIDAGADFVMVSHQIVTGVGDNMPSCLSYTVCTDLLRNELQFQGIIITDSFQMNTIAGSYSPADSAVLAIDAGVDVILMPTDLTASVQALENAVYTGRISEERINQSVERILLEKEKLNLLG